MTGTRKPRWLIQAALSAREMTFARLAEAIKIKPRHLSSAIHVKMPSFTFWRYRLRIERFLGQRFWTTEREAAELAALEKWARVDLATAEFRQIRESIRKASSGECGDRLYSGFEVINQALHWLNPASDTSIPGSQRMKLASRGDHARMGNSLPTT
jgi:hypothetical protein